MNSSTAHNYRLDQMIKEGIEHMPTFWALKLKCMQLVETEAEFARGMLAIEMNEFRRKVIDNDKPGRRHMLPFVWRGGEKVFITANSHLFDHRMREYDSKMAALKQRTPNYGRKI